MHWRSLVSDDGAAFDREIEIDVAGLAPMITWGTSPQHAVGIDGRVPEFDASGTSREAYERALAYMDLRPGQALESLPIGAAFIGSCTNSRLSDLRRAAAVLRGRRVAPGVRAICVPGSMSVKRQAEAEGLDRIFARGRLRVARVRLLDVLLRRRRELRAARARRLVDEPQFREPAGSRDPHPHREPGDRGRKRDHGPPRRRAHGSRPERPLIVAVQVLVIHRGRIAERLEVREDRDRRQCAPDVGFEALEQLVALLYRPLGRHQHVQRDEPRAPDCRVRSAWYSKPSST